MWGTTPFASLATTPPKAGQSRATPQTQDISVPIPPVGLQYTISFSIRATRRSHIIENPELSGTGPGSGPPS